MRPMPDERLERMRDVGAEMDIYGFTGARTVNGVFRIHCRGELLRIIANDDQGEGWEHVSVSFADLCPTWEEMCYVKDLFWLPDEAVMQLHPPQSEWVNNHPYCLHLWRPTKDAIPLPPSIYVGVKNAGTLKNADEARALRARLIIQHKGKTMNVPTTVQWQSIETAPMGATVIAGYWRKSAEWHTVIIQLGDCTQNACDILGTDAVYWIPIPEPPTRGEKP